MRGGVKPPVDSTQVHFMVVIALLYAGVDPALAERPQSKQSAPYSLEGYPTEIAKSLLERKLAEDEAIKKTPAPGAFALMAKNFAWQNGTKFIVAFQGGNFEVWRDIAAIAAQWSKVANVSFDFGIDPVTRSARTYQPTDPPAIAQIRIDLKEADSRLRWSAVGRQALSSEFAAASMQLGGIVQNHPHWTDEDRADILHEFGHVLGFLHEHQRPECQAEYRLEPGPHGEPTIFEAYHNLYGVPLDWIKANVFLSNAYKADASGKLDKESLFLYPTEKAILPATFSGIKGPCYIKKKNTRISANDARRARRDYPFQPSNAFGTLAATNIPPLKVLASTDELAISPQLVEKVERIELAARPLVYIHITNEGDRSAGERLRRALLESQYVAPGVENIRRKAKPPASTEVRYFSHADRASAEAVARQIGVTLEADTTVAVKFQGKTAMKKLPIEVWLPESR